MTLRDPSKKPASTAPNSRDARLKAALKANMGRRKVQAKLRAAGDETNTDTDCGQTED